MKTRLGRLLGLTFIVAVVMFVTVATAMAVEYDETTTDISEKNKVGYWCEDGIKYEPVDTPFIVPAPPAGTTWTLIVLKGGTTNQTHATPKTGETYSHSEHENSHVILCYEEASTTTTEPSTTTSSSSTTSSTSSTTTSSTTTSSTTTTSQPTTRSTVAETTTSSSTTTTVVDPTTTTQLEATTTVPPTTTTTVPTLPVTGIPDDVLPLGVALLVGGVLLLLSASWLGHRRSGS